MFYCDETLNKQIILYNEAIKDSVKANNSLCESEEFSLGKKIVKLKKNGVLKTFKNKVVSYFDINMKNMKEYDTKYPILRTAVNDRTDTNYFFDKRIAVYTCIIGPYDKPIEPHVKPDNIDYYIVTDQEVSVDSAWQKIDINTFDEVKNVSNVLKARFFKINAHKLFKNYDYSIYVDGNFEINTDLTEHVNRISDIGFSLFRHCQRICVYDEIDACKLLNKAKIEELQEYEEKLLSVNMPKNYGLVETGMLVRKHNEPKCINLMEDWWKEIKTNIHRDQITLPYVLYKNSIKIDEVATLGNNIRNDFSFNIISHS